MVELERVTKRFREHLAVEAFDMRVPAGSLFGIIGPNGSGKTTTLRMILRIIEPDSGSIRVLGRPRNAAANNRIGYLPEERGLYRKMTVLRQLIYFGNLKGMDNRSAKKAALEWLERLNLIGWKDSKLEALSKGMSQKVQFVATVMANPVLLILDEPFTGLDPVNMEVLRDTLLELRKSGTTIVFSTHDMHTAERLCDHICMIHQGRKVLEGSMEEIQGRYGQDTLRLRYRDGILLEAGIITGTSHVRHLGRYWEMHFRGNPHEAMKEAILLGELDHFEVVHPSLHDIFIRIAQPREEVMEGGLAREAPNA